MLFNYADDPSQGEGIDRLTIGDVENHFMNSTKSVNNFIKENSYNKAWLGPTFIDWRTLPGSLASYNGNVFYAIKDGMQLLDDEVDFTQYKTLVFIFLNGGGGNLFGMEGTGFGGYPLPYTTDASNYHASVVLLDHRAIFGVTPTHELGHSMGFGHASALTAVGGPAIPPDLINLSPDKGFGATTSYHEYGDDDDIMGGGDGHVSTIFKNKAGWLVPGQVETVTQSGEYTLDQLQLPSSGVKMIKLPLGKKIKYIHEDGDESYYFMEYRKPLGLFETADSVQVRLKNRVYFYDGWAKRLNWGENTLRFVNADIVTADQPFIDPYRGIKIELLEKTGEGADSKARIKITYSGVDTDKGNLVDFQEYFGHPNPQTMTLSNNSQEPLTIGQTTIEGRDPTSWTILEDNISNRTIEIGQSATIKLYYTPVSKGFQLGYLKIPTSSQIRPEATISLYGYDGGAPGHNKWPRDPVTTSISAISTNISKTNTFTLSWIAEDYVPIAGYQLQYRPHTTTAWTTKSWTTSKSVSFTGKEGYTYYFRVRAKDSGGYISNWTLYNYEKGFTVIPFDSTSINYSSGWYAANLASAYKGSVKYTYKKGAYATKIYRHKSGLLALIAPSGPKRGKVRIYVRDKIKGVWTSWKDTRQTIDLYSPNFKARQYFLFDPRGQDYDNYIKTDTHQLKFVATGTKNKSSGGYRVDIDGLAIQRGL